MLPELLVAKFNHDIAGLLSAIRVGLDYIDNKDPGIRKQSLEILFGAAGDIVAKIDFLRELYSIVHDDNCYMGIDSLERVVRNFLPSVEIQFESEEKERSCPINNVYAKIILCFISIFRDLNVIKSIKVIFSGQDLKFYMALGRAFDDILGKLDKILSAKSLDDAMRNETSAPLVRYVDLYYFRYIKESLLLKSDVHIKKNSQKSILLSVLSK